MLTSFSWQYKLICSKFFSRPYYKCGGNLWWSHCLLIRLQHWQSFKEDEGWIPCKWNCINFLVWKKKNPLFSLILWWEYFDKFVSFLQSFYSLSWTTVTMEREGRKWPTNLLAVGGAKAFSFSFTANKMIGLFGPLLCYLMFLVIRNESSSC